MMKKKKIKKKKVNFYGLGKFNHKLSSYTIYDIDNYWNQNLVNNITEYKRLSASWIEFVLGFNAEVLKNTYMGISLRLNRTSSNRIYLNLASNPCI